MNSHERQRHPCKTRSKHDEHLAYVSAKQEHQIFLDVLKDGSAFLNRSDDGGKVIIRQHHGGGFFADIGASNTHSDADISFLESGSVINAIPCHGYDVPLLAEGF